MGAARRVLLPYAPHDAFRGRRRRRVSDGRARFGRRSRAGRARQGRSRGLRHALSPPRARAPALPETPQRRRDARRGPAGGDVPARVEGHRALPVEGDPGPVLALSDRHERRELVGAASRLARAPLRRAPDRRARGGGRAARRTGVAAARARGALEALAGGPNRARPAFRRRAFDRGRGARAGLPARHRSIPDGARARAAATEARKERTTMKHDDELKSLESLRSSDGGARGADALEERVWTRVEESRVRRAKRSRRWAAGALVVLLAGGVAFGASASRPDGWARDVVHFIHQHLIMIHDHFAPPEYRIQGRHHAKPKAAEESATKEAAEKPESR